MRNLLRKAQFDSLPVIDPTDNTAESDTTDLSAMLEALDRSQAMIEFRPDGTIVSANRKFLATMEYELDDIQGRHHSMFVDDQIKESSAYGRFWNDLKDGKFQVGEFQRWAKDGKEVWLQATYNPVLNSAGETVKVVMYAVDITEQKLLSLKADADANRLATMVANMPINVMMCDPEDLTINYVNDTSVATLKTLEHLLPCKADDLLGQCIDIFHKDPSHQRRILSNPNNLPYNAKIQLGEEILDLTASAITDESGEYLGPMLSWSVVTDQVKAEADTERLVTMVDNMPINILMCDPEDFTITYSNETSTNTLRQLEHLLPCKADNLIGQCIDIFHKNPTHQRTILSDPSNLPHTARITLGEDTLDLKVSAIMNSDNKYLGPMVSWAVVTQQAAMADNFETNVLSVVEQLTASAEAMKSAAETMAANAEETNQQAVSVAAASEEASTNVGTVAAAAEELSNTVQEIGRQVEQSTKITLSAVEEATKTNETVEGLSEAANSIGEVVSLINDIASQTNLLALNATIEAARAGEAGKGFAVVASEVKSLATQTAKATDDIGKQISEIQTATNVSVQAIKGIGVTIGEISEIATAIASAVEEQGAATTEISNNTQQASAATTEVSSNIAGVTQAASETGEASRQVLDETRKLSEQAVTLREQVEKFLVEVRAM